MLEVGQIRRLSYMDPINSSRIVLISTLNPIKKQAQIILINNVIEAATNRDVIISPSVTGLKYSIAIWTDFSDTAEYELLEASPVLGKVDATFAQLASIFAITNPTGSVEELSKKHQFNVGEYLPQAGDHIANFRADELEAFTNLTNAISDWVVNGETFSRLFGDLKVETSKSLLNYISENGLEEGIFDSLRPEVLEGLLR